ncbi:hypothetical protein [Actinacidiphila glaucinigra]|uniref:hypothetical protein n=1 Tax=Actinacidiphila glaucinigra TaxID=235986 RepID=UPI002E32DC69|nr:hypothetical protein [Actinacidiphila glaucinigra]
MPFKTLEGDGKVLTVMPFDAERLVAAGIILAGLNPRISDVRQSGSSPVVRQQCTVR